MIVAGRSGYYQGINKVLQDGETKADFVASLKLKKESIRAVTINEMKDWGRLLRMLAHEKYGKGDANFDYTWNDNINYLAEELVKLGLATPDFIWRHGEASFFKW